MKKIRDNIKFFIGMMVGILCSGITAYAAYSYLAIDVTYAPNNSEWNVDNVEDALDYLYNITKYEITSDNIDIVNYSGDRTASKSLTKTIESGKYLLFVTENAQAISNLVSNVEVDYMSFSLSGDDSSCSLLSNKAYRATASDTINSTTTSYNQSYTIISIYYCDLDTSKNITITSNDTLKSYSHLAETLNIHAVKIRD